MRRPSFGKFNLKKITALAVAVNLIQICAALALLLFVVFNRSINIPEQAEIALLAVMAGVIIWGAVVDIRDARITRKVDEQRIMLEEAYRQLEDLNQLLREQRHDFKNHLQVVYSLTEMGAYSDAQEYVQRIYEDVQALGSRIRTASPAVNALLSAKQADCEERGVALEIGIQSAWEEIPVPGWELCRILGNLIDNAADALEEGKTANPHICVCIAEDIRCWALTVANNGPEIPRSHVGQIFLPGFTTKSEGHGNGLGIVTGLVEKYGGKICVESSPERTVFTCTIPKNAQ